MEIVFDNASGDGEVLEALGRHWPPRGLETVGTAEPNTPVLRMRISVHDDVKVRVDGDVAPGGWDRVESTLGLFATEHLSSLVTVHAALVLSPSGAIVVPGPTHSGKSTLAWAARQRGLEVLSDEYALIDPASGLVQGWPRPLRRRTPRGVERTILSARECELAAVDHRVALVAVVRFDRSPLEFVNPKRSDVILRILENTVCARRRPDDSFRAALALTSQASLLEGTRNDATSFWDTILDSSHRIVR